MKLKIFLAALGSMVLMLSACGGGNGGSLTAGDSGAGVIYDDGGINTRPRSCDAKTFNHWMEHDYFRPYYLWGETISLAIQGEDYAQPEQTSELFYSMLDSNDRFSFIQTVAQAKQDEAGEYRGLGVLLDYYEETIETQTVKGFLLTRVFSDSGAARAKLQRGDLIVSIDGADFSRLEKEQIIEVFIGLAERDSMPAVIRRGDSLLEVDVEIGAVTTDTVSAVKLFEVGDKTVGYFSHLRFAWRAEDKLYDNFETLYNAGVDELVLDLRDNGGGILYQALVMANQFIQDASNSYTGRTFARMIYNPRRSEENRDFQFLDVEEGLGLKTVYFLTNQSSCSASEQIISFLMPYLDRYEVIGDTTCGKPTGMEVIERCDRWSMAAVTFRLQNLVGFTDWWSGIPVSCRVEEDYSKAFAAEDEPLLAQALSFSAGGACSSSVDAAAAPRNRKQSRAFRARVYEPNQSRMDMMTW